VTPVAIDWLFHYLTEPLTEEEDVYVQKNILATGTASRGTKSPRLGTHVLFCQTNMKLF
jgi:hypothetical protein